MKFLRVFAVAKFRKLLKKFAIQRFYGYALIVLVSFLIFNVSKNRLLELFLFQIVITVLDFFWLFVLEFLLMKLSFNFFELTILFFLRVNTACLIDRCSLIRKTLLFFFLYFLIESFIIIWSGLVSSVYLFTFLFDITNGLRHVKFFILYLLRMR